MGQWHLDPMLTPPPSLLTEWLQPGAVVAGLVGIVGLLMNAFRGLEARINQRISEFRSELKEELRASEARQTEEIKASEARQTEELREVKVELRLGIKGLGGKLDRLMESLLAVKS